MSLTLSVAFLTLIKTATASTLEVPTEIVTAGNEAVLTIRITGGEQIGGASLDLAAQEPLAIVAATADGETIWPEGSQLFPSPPTPPLPASRSVLNFGILDASTTAEGTLARVVVDVPEGTPFGIYVFNLNAQFSQIVQPDATVQPGTIYRPGLIIVLPAVQGEPAQFVRILAELIRLWLFAQFGFPIV